MNILMLSSSFPRYEGDFFGPWVLEYCRELVRQGHQVTLVAPCAGKMDLKHLSEKGLRVERFNYWYPRTAQQLVFPPGIIPQLKAKKWRYLQVPFMVFNYHRKVQQLAKSGKFDIVHSQWVIPSGYLGTKVAKKYKLPHVITSQGAEFFLPVDHPFSQFTKATLLRCDYLFPVSAQMGGRALLYGIQKEKIKVIPNTVNPEVFKPNIPSDFREKYGISPTTKIILTIRRLVFEKRVEDVIEAFAQLPKEEDAILIIGGDGPERTMLENLCEKLNVAGKVKFIGFINNKDLPPIYAACNLYILSSQQEGLSLSLLEAMASELIIITTGSTGGSEVIVHGENGFVYEVGDVKGLGLMMEKVIASEEKERKEWGVQARSTVVDRFSVKGMVQSWVEIYQSVLNN